MSFAPGDEVVCVDDALWDEKPRRGIARKVIQVVKGQHYVVRDAGVVNHPMWGEYQGVWIKGIVRRDSFGDTPFDARRFRPVRREAVEQFKRMCISTKPLVEV